MSGAHYGLGDAAGWLERQQRRIAELETENRELRRQLDDLKHGIGITVLIQGRPVALAPQGTPPTGQHSAYTPTPALLPAPFAAAPQPLALPAPQSAYHPTYAPHPGYVAPHRAQDARPAQDAYWPPVQQPSAHMPSAPAPTQQPRHAPPFAEDAWLTDHMPAITAQRSTQPTAPHVPRTGAPSRTSTRSARGVPPQAPSWLLDDAAGEQSRMTGAPSERARAEGNRRSMQPPYEPTARSGGDPRSVKPMARPSASAKNTGQYRAAARPTAYGGNPAPRHTYDEDVADE